MAFGTKVQFNPIGVVAAASVPATYGVFGPALPGHARIIRFVNGTDANIYISADGTTDHIRLAPNSYVLFDFSTNRIQDDGLFVAEGTQFYLKYVAAATTGSAWIEVITAAGGV